MNSVLYSFISLVLLLLKVMFIYIKKKPQNSPHKMWDNLDGYQISMCIWINMD